MMRILAPILLAVLGVVGGVAVGVVMKPPAETTDKEAKDAKKGAKKESAEFSDKDLIDKASDSEYLPLEKKVLAPFSRSDGRAAFVAVDITLELAPGYTDFAREHTPKLTAAFLIVVTKFASSGAFDDHQHAPHTLKELNGELHKAAVRVLGKDTLRKVLIANLLTSDA